VRKNIVVNLQIVVVKSGTGHISTPRHPVVLVKVCRKRTLVQEFIAEMINSLKSLEIGMRVLLIRISLELMASIWSTLTI
jgi:hypothetical protein